MHYVEWSPPAAHRNHIDCLWHLTIPARREPQIETVYPDGRCELVIHRAAPPSAQGPDGQWQPQPRVLFAGQFDSAIRLRRTAALDCIGIRLRPAASTLVVGDALPTLRNSFASVAATQPDLAETLATIATRPAQWTVHSAATLWACLLAPCSRQPVDPRIEAAVQRQEQAHGLVPIETLARDVAMSLRAFQTRFLSVVGLPAKPFARVLRLQATLKAMQQTSESVTAIAASGGFADQAHATREMRAMTGLTPATLRRALRADPTSDDAIRMAAAFVRGRSSVSA